MTGDIGGNLNIQSLQDTAKFDSKSQSASGTVAYQGASVSASVSLAQTKVSADYLSVNEQSAIKAGDNGFQLNVKGNTALDGSVISASQKAVDEHRNTLTTGTLTSSDLQNHSQYDAQSVSVTVGTSGGSAGAFQSSGNTQSTTKAGISGADVILTKGDAPSQQTLSKLDRSVTDQSTGSGIKQNWNGQKLAEQTQLNAQIVQAFGAEAAKRAGTYADDRSNELLKQASQAYSTGDRDEAGQLWDEAQKWAEGGAYRVALHGMIGGLTGGVQGALGGLTSQAAVPEIGKLIKESDLPLELKQGLVLAAGTAVGALVGGAEGATTGLDATANNFLSKNNQLKKNEALAVLRKDEQKNWFEALLNPTTGLLDAAQTQEALKYLDSRSDTLLEAYRQDKNALTPREVNELAVYLGDYAQSYGKQAADDLLKYGSTSLNPGDLPALSLKAQALLRSNDVQVGQAGIGTPALEMLGGTVGLLVRAVQAAQSSTQIGLGIGALNAGDTSAGFADVGLGVLGYTVAVGGQYVAGKTKAVDSLPSGCATGASCRYVGEPQMPETYVSPEMQQKILWGQRQLREDGTPSNGLIGAHSGQIDDDLPNYAVEVLRNNADGTSSVKLVTQFSDGNVSKIKTSTLFPTGWSSSDIFDAIQKVGARQNAVATRVSDGSTLYQGTVNGVNMEVVKIGNRVTAAYPTGGGFSSLDTFGLTPKPPKP